MTAQWFPTNKKFYYTNGFYPNLIFVIYICPILFIMKQAENFYYLLDFIIVSQIFKRCGREECMCKTSVVCRTTSHAMYNLPFFASRHVSKVQKWLRSAQRQTLTLVLNVIVKGKRTSKISHDEKCLTWHSHLHRTNKWKHNIYSKTRVNSQGKLVTCRKLAIY